jgi:thioredoxin-related protein
MQKVIKKLFKVLPFFILAVFMVSWAFSPARINEEVKSQGLREKEAIQWLTLAEAEKMYKSDPRPILIDLYTDWCGWCKVMDKKTYTHSALIKYVNEKFYPVKLDAESRQEFSWNGKAYRFNDRYKTNDIALFLTGGQLSYPTTSFLVPGYEDPQPVPGYLQPADMQLLLTYFGEGHFGKKDFQQYQAAFKPTWK